MVYSTNKLLSLICCLLIMSAAYIQIPFRLILIMEANTMNPDQTATKGEV